MEKEQIGGCTLYCGDCLEVMPGLSDVDAVIADPPYGCTKNSWDVPINLEAFWEKLFKATKKAAPAIIFARMPFAADLVASNRKFFRYELVFKKNKGSRFLDAARQPLPIHENLEIFYRQRPVYNPQMTRSSRPLSSRKQAGRKIGASNWSTNTCYASDWHDSGLRYPVSVIEVKWEKDFFRKNDYPRHPVQKLVQIMEWLAKTYSNSGDTILDPFMGSGTTGLACIKNNRKFIGIEQDRHWFDVACERLRKAVAENESSNES